MFRDVPPSIIRGEAEKKEAIYWHITYRAENVPTLCVIFELANMAEFRKIPIANVTMHRFQVQVDNKHYFYIE